jgi:hypothetical protein
MKQLSRREKVFGSLTAQFPWTATPRPAQPPTRAHGVADAGLAVQPGMAGKDSSREPLRLTILAENVGWKCEECEASFLGRCWYCALCHRPR